MSGREKRMKRYGGFNLQQHCMFSGGCCSQERTTEGQYTDSKQQVEASFKLQSVVLSTAAAAVAAQQLPPETQHF
jgi:hypothetical protein